MPKYRYTGQGPCRYGSQPVNPGDIVDASAKPGKNFVEVEAPKQEPARRRSSATEAASE